MNEILYATTLIVYGILLGINHKLRKRNDELDNLLWDTKLLLNLYRGAEGFRQSCKRVGVEDDYIEELLKYHFTEIGKKEAEMREAKNKNKNA